MEFRFLKKEIVEERSFQTPALQELLATDDNACLVVPTSGGKTFMAFILADRYLSDDFVNKDLFRGKVLFMAPTQPLLRQHYELALTAFTYDHERIRYIDGGISASKRETLWASGFFFFATPQVVANDAAAGRMDMNDFAFIVCDESHIADDTYAYIDVVNRAEKARVISITASPGDTWAKIQRARKNLKATRYVIIRKEEIQQAGYAHLVCEEVVHVPVSDELAVMMNELERVMRRIGAELHRLYFLDGTGGILRRKELNDLWEGVQSMIAANDSRTRALSAQRYLSGYSKILHMYDTLITLGYDDVLEYWTGKIRKDRSKSGGSIRKTTEVVQIVSLCREYDEEAILHPKQEYLVELLMRPWMKGKKILLFTKTRASAEILQKIILRKTEFIPVTLVGQAGMKQKQQQANIDAFRQGAFNLLIATSVAEAGLHIPEVDEVIHYVPPNTGIAYIQRGGRVGRTHAGTSRYLLMEHELDAGLFFGSRASAHRMEDLLSPLDLPRRPRRQKVIDGRQIPFDLL